MTEIDEFLSAWTDAEPSGDSTSLERLLTDDFLGVGPLGAPAVPSMPGRAAITKEEEEDRE